ncbi:MAG TPA: CBS domain-containing protein [Solirubrobacteraceae bacterium]|jgi:CBS domain-containing protein|nr:CBS domain-containing protein [Solirubrobacteraceae bacterium]
MASEISQPGSDAAEEVCRNESVDRHDAPGLRVRDAMVASPKTVPAQATVGDLRAMFANPHVVTALLVDGSRFVGLVHRAQVDDQMRDERPAGSLASRDVPTIDPDAPLTDALAILDAGHERRLVVLDGDGDRLRGLLCLTGDRRGFCQS